MVVTLADGSTATATSTSIVPLVLCSISGQAMFVAVECRVLPKLNHDVVLGVDWLQDTNPVIDWQACTVSTKCTGTTAPVVFDTLPVESVARV